MGHKVRLVLIGTKENEWLESRHNVATRQQPRGGDLAARSDEPVVLPGEQLQIGRKTEGHGVPQAKDARVVAFRHPHGGGRPRGDGYQHHGVGRTGVPKT
jgi:hypothetical protein